MPCMILVDSLGLHVVGGSQLPIKTYNFLKIQIYI